MKGRHSRAGQWCWPILLANLTILGLLVALFGEGGVWWGASWLLLSIPLAVAIWHSIRRQ